MRDFDCYMFTDTPRKEADSLIREVLAWGRGRGFLPDTVEAYRSFESWKEYAYTDDEDAARRILAARMAVHVQGAVQRGAATLSFWGNRATLQFVVVSLGAPGYLRLVEQAGIESCKDAVRELAARCQPLAIICGRELTEHREQYVSRGIQRLHWEHWRHFWRDLSTRGRLPLLLHYNLISRRIPVVDPKSREIVSKASVIGGYLEIDEWEESGDRRCEEGDIQRIRKY